MRERLSCASEPSCYGADGGRQKQRLLAGRVDGESSGASTTPRPVDYVGAEASATLEAWCGISARGGPNSGQRLNGERGQSFTSGVPVIVQIWCWEMGT